MLHPLHGCSMLSTSNLCHHSVSGPPSIDFSAALPVPFQSLPCLRTATSENSWCWLGMISPYISVLVSVTTATSAQPLPCANILLLPSALPFFQLLEACNTIVVECRGVSQSTGTAGSVATSGRPEHAVERCQGRAVCSSVKGSLQQPQGLEPKSLQGHASVAP